MRDYSMQHKKAWEYNAYEFWVKNAGTPSERAKQDMDNPVGMLRRYSQYFDTYDGVKVAYICGSCGKFDEHPAWTNDKVPGEFTAVAVK